MGDLVTDLCIFYITRVKQEHHESYEPSPHPPKKKHNFHISFVFRTEGGSPELCKLDDTFIATAFYNLSFSRWVAEAIFEIEAKQNSEVLSDIISRVQIDNHYDLQSYNICIIALISMGIGFRVIALLLLLFTKRGQQR